MQPSSLSSSRRKIQRPREVLEATEGNQHELGVVESLYPVRWVALGKDVSARRLAGAVASIRACRPKTQGLKDTADEVDYQWKSICIVGSCMTAMAAMMGSSGGGMLKEKRTI